MSYLNTTVMSMLIVITQTEDTNARVSRDSVEMDSCATVKTHIVYLFYTRRDNRFFESNKVG